ncbi:MAG: T9SS type A sorting domain-containing protein [Bacteroidia bacterium]|nr:T9SS type A sorting domain-containing protein [Bacteroidia bacterium]
MLKLKGIFHLTHSVICFFLMLNLVNAQTPVSGGIYNSTSWTLAGSPYLITGPIVVFPGKTLTIEPGVIVKVQANTDTITGISQNYLEIRGNLVAVGTPSAPIVFTTDSVNSPNFIPVYTPYEQWNGIRIKTEQGATASFDYFTLDHSGYGIDNLNDSASGTISINHCTFSNNTWGLNMFGNIVIDSCIFINNYYPLKGDPINSLNATNCVFSQNHAAISYYGGGSNFTNCIFDDNEYAIQNSAGGTLSNCTFTNNDFAIYNAYSGYDISNCTFTGNGEAFSLIDNSSITNCQITGNGLGIGVGSGMIIQNCEIKNNQTGLRIYGPVISDVKDNEICNNSLYNVENASDMNLGLEKNCFCSSDSAIVEGLIYDGYDDITRGLFNYAIYDSACQNVLYYVTKVNLGTTNLENEVITPAFTLYPNPASGFLTVETTHASLFNTSLSIYDMNGRLMKNNIFYTGDIARLDIRDLPNGIYILSENASGNRQKFVKQ